jgi:hypothetical protein
MSKFPKTLTAMTLVVGMALGSVLTLALNPLGAASALVGAAAPAKGNQKGVLQQALDTLVGNGTINQSQANAIQNQVRTNRDARLAQRPALRKGVVQEIAAKFNMSLKDLVAELRTGKSLADVAKEKGVDPVALGQQIVAALDARIDAAVAKHRLTTDEANTMKQALPGRVTAFLNRTWPKLNAHPNERPSAPNATPAPAAPSPTAPATTAPSTTAPPTSGNGSGNSTGSGATSTTGH